MMVMEAKKSSQSILEVKIRLQWKLESALSSVLPVVVATDMLITSRNRSRNISIQSLSGGDKAVCQFTHRRKKVIKLDFQLLPFQLIHLEVNE